MTPHPASFSPRRAWASLLALLLILAPVLGVGGCARSGEVDPAIQPPGEGQDLIPTTRPGELLRPGVTDPTLQTIRSPHGAVAAASVWAAEAGARVLAEGGNAADAAVAAAWALAVTEPSMSGLGGRASIVIRTPGGEVNGIDGLNQVPRSYREGVAPAGYDRAAIPGVPAALARLHAEHGSLPMARLLDPALRLAEEGFELPAPEAERFRGAAEDLLAHSPEAARGTFLQSDGTPWPAGTRLRQPDLARTLRILRDEGVEAFYRGEVARTIDADMRARGGFVTADELAAYEALPARIVQGTYRGHALVSNFRPASGHAVIQALQTLEAATPEGVPPVSRGAGIDPEGHARWAALLGQAMGQAIEERNRVVEGSEAAAAALLTSRGHARTRAGELLHPWMEEVGREGVSTLFLRPGWRAEGGQAESMPGRLVTDPRDRESTTHLTVVDARGMAVSLTQSLGPSMGARVVAPGLGFLYATRLGAEPGSRPSSTIAPTLVLRPDGSLLAGLGGAGDARILSAVIQTVSRMIDHGLPLDQAVAAPRVHPDGERRFRVEVTEEGAGEGGWSAAERRRLEAWGFELEHSPPGYFGRVHAVGWTPGIPVRATGGVPDPARVGEAHGVAEPRWNGGAAAPREAPPAGPGGG
jgi:gamma-glutamyltranspeptidase/glutathione hydrolase